MTWLDHHQVSERAASAAHEARRQGLDDQAKLLFAQVAEAETKALRCLNPSDKPRTYGITAVSAVALYYKAALLKDAERLAHSILSQLSLPEFAIDQLRELLQPIWNEQAQTAAGVQFAPGQVTVSVDGGEVVRGGAPLDLVVERVQTIQSIFYRTAEFLKRMPLRRSGPVTKPIQDLCRPWLFQSVPGSYQFMVAIQGPIQTDLYKQDDPGPELVASTFMAILEGAAMDPKKILPNVVPDQEYRSTFLKLARNLAPAGQSFTQMETRSAQGMTPIVLTKESRKAMTRIIRNADSRRLEEIQSEEFTVRRVLRAVHLEKDWLELSIDDKLERIEGVGETVDDVIGPMVNHAVMVQVTKDRKSNKYQFRDIEFDDSL